MYLRTTLDKDSYTETGSKRSNCKKRPATVSCYDVKDLIKQFESISDNKNLTSKYRSDKVKRETYFSRAMSDDTNSVQPVVLNKDILNKFMQMDNFQQNASAKVNFNRSISTGGLATKTYIPKYEPNVRHNRTGTTKKPTKEEIKTTGLVLLRKNSFESQDKSRTRNGAVPKHYEILPKISPIKRRNNSYILATQSENEVQKLDTVDKKINMNYVSKVISRFEHPKDVKKNIVAVVDLAEDKHRSDLKNSIDNILEDYAKLYKLDKSKEEKRKYLKVEIGNALINKPKILSDDNKVEKIMKCDKLQQSNNENCAPNENTDKVELSNVSTNELIHKNENVVILNKDNWEHINNKEEEINENDKQTGNDVNKPSKENSSLITLVFHSNNEKKEENNTFKNDVSKDTVETSSNKPDYLIIMHDNMTANSSDSFHKQTEKSAPSCCDNRQTETQQTLVENMANDCVVNETDETSKLLTKYESEIKNCVAKLYENIDVIDNAQCPVDEDKSVINTTNDKLKNESDDRRRIKNSEKCNEQEPNLQTFFRRSSRLYSGKFGRHSSTTNNRSKEVDKKEDSNNNETIKKVTNSEICYNCENPDQNLIQDDMLSETNTNVTQNDIVSAQNMLISKFTSDEWNSEAKDDKIFLMNVGDLLDKQIKEDDRILLMNIKDLPDKEVENEAVADIGSNAALVNTMQINENKLNACSLPDKEENTYRVDTNNAHENNIQYSKDPELEKNERILLMNIRQLLEEENTNSLNYNENEPKNWQEVSFEARNSISLNRKESYVREWVKNIDLNRTEKESIGFKSDVERSHIYSDTTGNEDSSSEENADTAIKRTLDVSVGLRYLTYHDCQNNPIIRLESNLDLPSVEWTACENSEYKSIHEDKLEEAEKEYRRSIENIVNISKKHGLMVELVSTERTYTDVSLYRVVHGYMTEMKRKDLPGGLAGKVLIIFGNINYIYKCHKKYFLPALEFCKSPDDIANCFLKHENIFKLYPLYSRNKPKSEEILRDYGYFFREKQKILRDQLDLASYLLRPIQRLAQYCLLVKSLIKECEKENIDSRRLKLALDMLEKQMRHGNDLIATDSIINCNLNLQEQGPLLLRNVFTVVPPNKKPPFEAMLFLYEENLLITYIYRHNATEKFSFRDNFKMTDMGYTNNEYDPYMFKIWYRKHGQKTYELRAKQKDVKEKWTDQIHTLLWKQLEANKKRRKKEQEQQGVKVTRVPLSPRPASEIIKRRSINHRIVKKSGSGSIWYKNYDND